MTTPPCDFDSFGGNGIKCAATPTHVCACTRCDNEPTEEEKFHTCDAHRDSVSTAHQRVRGREAVWVNRPVPPGTVSLGEPDRVSDPARRHAPPKALYKTTLVVWTEVDPNAARVLRWDALGILCGMEDLGTAYVSKSNCVPMNPHEVAQDPDWDGAEFFDKEETTNE